jgi:hypothetical protein
MELKKKNLGHIEIGEISFNEKMMDIVFGQIS